MYVYIKEVGDTVLYTPYIEGEACPLLYLSAIFYRLDLNMSCLS